MVYALRGFGLPSFRLGKTPRLACVRRAAFAPRVIRRFFIALAIFFSLNATAAEIRPEILPGPNASVSSDLTTGEALVTGGAELIFGDARLTADELRHNRRTDVATAKGHVIFTRGTRRLLAD